MLATGSCWSRRRIASWSPGRSRRSDARVRGRPSSSWGHSGRSSDRFRSPVVFHAPVRSSIVVEVLLAADHEERQAQGEAMEPAEIEVTPVHHIEGPGLDRQGIEGFHVVGLAVGDPHKTGDIAAQVQERVQLDGPPCDGEIWPEGTRPSTGRWWWNPARKWFAPRRRRIHRPRTAAAPARSRPAPDPHRFASRVSRWLWPGCSWRSSRGSRRGRVSCGSRRQVSMSRRLSR